MATSTLTLVCSFHFANVSSREGGQLEGDRRCSDAAPRIETVVFPAPARGRYRVGVDYPKACADRDTVAFVVYLETEGRREERRRSVQVGEFIPIVLEVEESAEP